MKRLLLYVAAFGVLFTRLACTQPAPSEPLPAVKGTLKSLVFTDSKIYPGTRHDVTVYIPPEYDGSQPACVYVQQDGLKDGANHTEKQEKFLQTMETLIGTKEMPVTIGIFVSPGSINPTVSGTVGVANRSLEYDGVGDTYARFLIDELLPFVASTAKVKLSTNAGDRAIGGQSSGAAAAFNAAWERPDAFSRVYVCSGSFVAFRGGNELPTLIRKTEAKPIRAFFTVGDHDMENCAGDWTALNEELEKALKFSGYDYQFVHLHGGHCVGYPDNFPDAMRYLWKGWPAPIVEGTSAPRVQDILVSGEPWKQVADGYPQARTPVANAKGEIFFIDGAKDKILRLGLDGQINDFVADAGKASGLAFGGDGRLYAVSETTGKIMAYDSTGTGIGFADGVPGHDILAKGNGLYISAAGDNAGETGKIWFVGKDKKMVVDSGAIKNPTGMTLRPDQWLLNVADGASKWVYNFTINADGTLTNRERYYWLHVRDTDDDAGPESICYDQEGHFYVATRYGIQVCAWDGPTQVIIPMPDRDRATGLCLGRSGMDTLFAFSDGKIWQRKIKGHALTAFSPWMKMTPGKL